MPLAAPLGSATGARTYISLLDAPPIHIDLSQGATVAIVPDGTQRHFAGSDDRLQPALRGVPARLIELRGVHVGEAHLLVIAHERVAVDGNAALAGERR